MPNGLTKALASITQADITQRLEELERSYRAEKKELNTMRRLIALRVETPADVAALDDDGAEM